MMLKWLTTGLVVCELAWAAEQNSLPGASTLPSSNGKESSAAQPPVGWRGDGTGRYPSAKPATAWSATQNILWKTQIGAGQSSPVIAGNRVFATVEPDLLVCLDADSGKVLWQKAHKFSELAATLNAKDPGQSSEYGDINPTPVSDGQRVWVFVGTGLVACYDLDGTRRWIQAFDLPLTTQYGRTASPVLVGKHLLVHFGPLVCLEADSGKLLWKNDVAKASYGTPVAARIGDVDVLITPKGSVVRVHDGKILASELGNCMYPSPIISGRVVYFIDSATTAVQLPEKPAETIKCAELWYGDLPGEFFASPLLHAGWLYTVDKTGRFHVLDAKTGKVILQKPLEFSRTEGVNVYPSTCLAGQYLFVGNDAGETLLLEPNDQGKEVGRNTLPHGSGATPAFEGQRMFIRGGNTLYCISAP